MQFLRRAGRKELMTKRLRTASCKLTVPTPNWSSRCTARLALNPAVSLGWSYNTLPKHTSWQSLGLLLSLGWPWPPPPPLVRPPASLTQLPPLQTPESSLTQCHFSHTYKDHVLTLGHLLSGGHNSIAPGTPLQMLLGGITEQWKYPRLWLSCHWGLWMRKGHLIQNVCVVCVCV